MLVREARMLVREELVGQKNKNLPPSPEPTDPRAERAAEPTPMAATQHHPTTLEDPVDQARLHSVAQSTDAGQQAPGAEAPSDSSISPSTSVHMDHSQEPCRTLQNADKKQGKARPTPEQLSIHTFPPPPSHLPQQLMHNLCPGDLPTSLLLGLPPAMKGDLFTTYWGTSPTDIATNDRAIRKWLGLTQASGRKLAEQKNIQANLQHIVAEQDMQHHNARQIFAHIRGSYPSTSTFVPPPPCHEQPPEQPNIYTDGTLKDPKQAEFSLGAAAAWHPGRCLHTHPPNDSEASVAEFQQLLGGLRVLIEAPGQATSSTRTELIGAIVGLASPGPAHIATDSQSFLSKATYIHSHILTNTTPRTPWGLQTDGDLWRLYHLSATSKSLQAIKLTKVKGHATDQMVKDGEVRLQDQQGNDEADRAAEEALAGHGEHAASIGRALAKRQRGYARLVEAIHYHIAFMHVVRQHLLHCTTAPHSTPPQPNHQHKHTPTIAITPLPTPT